MFFIRALRLGLNNKRSLNEWRLIADPFIIDGGYRRVDFFKVQCSDVLEDKKVNEDQGLNDIGGEFESSKER